MWLQVKTEKMDKKNTINYAEAVERLEAIMNEVQSGTVDIDKLSSLLKEADELMKFCRSKLYEVDEEVKAVLQRMNDGVQ